MTVCLLYLISNILRVKLLEPQEFFTNVENISSLILLDHFNNAFIYPYFTFCVAVWGNACPDHLRPLILLQKRAIRTIMSADRRAHTAPLFHELKILRFEKIFIYCVQLFMYQFHHKCLPEIFQSFYQFNHEIHTRSTTSRDLLHVPRCSTSVRQNQLDLLV